MKLKYFNASELERMKCTVHTTGKMGFSESASKRLNLNDNKAIMIAKNEEEASDDSLYMKISDHIITEAFKVNKAGKYFYLNTKVLFDSLGYDYKKKTIIFDLIPIEVEGQKIYRMEKKEVPKKGTN